MDVLIVLVFISLVLVAGGLLFLLRTLKEGDPEHSDRLSLMPLARDERSDCPRPETTTPQQPKENP